MTDLIKRDDDLLWPSAYVGTPEQLLNCVTEMWRREKRVTVSAVLHATIETLRALPATDRIEELETRNKDLALQLLATSGQAADALDKLTKAMEALRDILSGDDLYPWRIAREVLAELGAGK